MQLVIDNDDNDDVEMIDFMSSDNIKMVIIFQINCFLCELYIDIFFFLSTTHMIFFFIINSSV